MQNLGRRWVGFQSPLSCSLVPGPPEGAGAGAGGGANGIDGGFDAGELALASGGTEDIYALFAGPGGEGIVQVSRSGEAHKLVSASSGGLWVDLVAIP